MDQILTIAIPTYNHHDLLLNQLNILLPQLTDQISLFILDNHNEPSVKEYLELNNFTYPNLKIIRNSVNIGGDANICRCFEICETDWLWVLSDNDYLKPDAVKIFINSINHNRDCVFINHNYDHNIEEIYTVGFNEFCQKCIYGNSFFISICGYNISKLKHYLIYYYKYLSSNQGQLMLILRFLEMNVTAKCLLTPYVLTTENLPAQWSRCEFIDNSKIVLHAFNGLMLKNFNKNLGQQINNVHLNHLIYARLNEGISIKRHLNYLISILNNSNISHYLEKDFYKPFLKNVFIILFPNIYKRLIRMI